MLNDTQSHGNVIMTMGECYENVFVDTCVNENHRIICTFICRFRYSNLCETNYFSTVKVRVDTKIRTFKQI